MSWRTVTQAIIVALGIESVASATSIAPPALPELIGVSEAVVMGKVVEIEPDRIELKIPLYKRRSQDPVKFAIARFQPTERLFNVPAGDTVRIAFVPDDQQPTDGLSLPTPILKIGETKLLYLRRDKDLLIASSYFSAGLPGEEEQAAAKLTRRICKLLETPAESLRSKSSEDRMLTAWTLAARCQRPMSTGENKLEPIAAEESRAIMDGLVLIPDDQARHLCHVVSGLAALTGKWDVNVSTANGFNTAGVRQWLRDHREDVQLLRYAGRELPAPGTKK